MPGRTRSRPRPRTRSTLTSSTYTLFGDEAEKIADVAREAEADLIVIASRGRGPFAGALLGSTTQRLLPIAACPVLVVPGGYAGHRLATAESSAIEA
jgi:nucleotide-binding universal stress UspA family protein